MSSLTLIAVVHAALLVAGDKATAGDSAATGESSYAEAHKIISETGRPMVVLVGAKWCPACQSMKKTVMPQILRRGLLRRCVYTVVDVDEQKELGKELTSGGPIPQLIMYCKTDNNWRRRRLIGGQSVNGVAKFIDQGIQLDEADKKAADDDAWAEEDRQASAKTAPRPPSRG